MIKLFYFFLLMIPLLQANDLAWRPPVQLATSYSEPVNIQAYLVSEKLDGIRGYWNGQALFTRGGNPILVPSWFIQGFPPFPLDGELWMGRDRFQSMLSLINRAKLDPERWRQVRFMVFDLPDSKAPFKERYRLMQSLLPQSAPFLTVIEQKNIYSQQQLDTLLAQVLAKGGEGLMLHRKAALYKVGRSPDLLKYKPKSIAQAEVVGYTPGKGQFKGMMGALVVMTPNGETFKLGTGFTHAQRKAPPVIGTTIRYHYYGLTEKGIPRFASFAGEIVVEKSKKIKKQ